MSEFQDENDKLKAGTLSDDPHEGTEVVDARDYLDDRVGVKGPGEKKVSELKLEPLEPLSQFAEKAAKELMDRINKRYDAIRSGFSDLDQLLSGGFWPGLYCLVGQPGAGKTQWALQFAQEAIKQNVPVLYVGLEMNRASILARWLGLRYGRSWQKFLSSYGDTKEFIYHPAGGRIERLSSEISNENIAEFLADIEAGSVRDLIYFDYAKALSWGPEHFEARSKEFHEIAVKHKEDTKHNRPNSVVIVDYMQLISASGENDVDARRRVGAASYIARDIADRLGSVVIMISSMARSNYKKKSNSGGDKTRKEASEFIGSGKESGEIEYSADAVFAMVREDDGSDIRMAIAKNRNGSTGDVYFTFGPDLKFESTTPIT